MGSIEAPIRVVVIGGSYAGLSAALNLYDYCNGKEARARLHDPVGGSGIVIPVEIKLVDERDGYCTFTSRTPSHLQSRLGTSLQ